MSFFNARILLAPVFEQLRPSLLGTCFNRSRPSLTVRVFSRLRSRPTLSGACFLACARLCRVRVFSRLRRKSAKNRCAILPSPKISFFMKTIHFALFFTAFSASGFGQNQIPQLSNLTAAIDFSAKKYTLNFDVADVENDSLRIILDLSSDGGQNFSLSNLPMTGDLGFPIFQKNGAKIEVDLSSLPDPLPTKLTARLSVFDTQPIDYQALVGEVDSLRLRDELDFIEGKRHRTGGPAHLQAVRDSLKNFLAGQCFAVRDQPFTAFTNYTAHNIFGRHAGFAQPKKTVIIDAHYDTVVNSPGADDNGSGVVGTIEAARILGKFPAENTLQFSFFDLEESGLLGSAAYNNNATGVGADEEILGAFNYEMIGFSSDAPNSQTVPTGFSLIFPGPYNQLQMNQFKGNFITNISNDISAAIETEFTAAATAYVPDLKVVTVHIPGNWQNAIYQDLLRSDHVSFWQKNRPSIQLTDGANFRNLCYHTGCDTATAKLNFTFMSNVRESHRRRRRENGGHQTRLVEGNRLPVSAAGWGEKWGQKSRFQHLPEPGQPRGFCENFG